VYNYIKGALLSLLMAVGGAAEAKVDYNPETFQMSITGATVWGDWTTAYRVLKENEVISVVLWGPGGNARAGAALAKLIRKHSLVAIVPENTRCISACAAMAAAATSTIVNGEVWFHGPYLSGVPAIVSPSDYARLVSNLNIEWAFLFEDWGYGRQFYRWMVLQTSPCRLFVVNNTEAFAALKEGRRDGTFVDNCPTSEQLIGVN